MEACIQARTAKGYCKMKYKIGSALNQIVDGVCICAFRLVYNITKNYLEDTIAGIKSGQSRDQRELSDITTVAGDHQMSIFIKDMLSKFNLELSKKQHAAMFMPNSAVQCSAYGWMDYYFNAVGDQEPNTDGEIHLGINNVYFYCFLFNFVFL